MITDQLLQCEFIYLPIKIQGQSVSETGESSYTYARPATGALQERVPKPVKRKKLAPQAKMFFSNSVNFAKF